MVYARIHLREIAHPSLNIGLYLSNKRYENLTSLNFINLTSNASFVVRMFELYTAGNHSFQTIAEEMNKLGMRNANGNPIGASRVEITLKNPFYFGVMRVKGEFYPHKYPPLIPEHLFDRVQGVHGGSQ